MRDSESVRTTVARGAVESPGNGRASGPSDPLDRSYLLRRDSRFPFPQLFLDAETVRLRRARRVSASFSAIPPLSRNGRS